MNAACGTACMMRPVWLLTTTLPTVIVSWAMHAVYHCIGNHTNDCAGTMHGLVTTKLYTSVVGRHL